MSVTMAPSRGWIPQTADKMVIGQDDLQLESITAQGLSDGLIVQSSLERIVVFTLNHPHLLLSDISHLRRVLSRAHASRAILFVRKDLLITSPVSLLATLSKIEIVRFNVETGGLCPSS
jgi:hypothetical protein